MRRLFLTGLMCACGIALSHSDVLADDSAKFRARAHTIAEKMQEEFDCKKRACLKKAIQYGGAKNQIPDKYRALMAEKLSALGEASEKEGRAVAGIIAALVGACTWRPEDCTTVVINSAHRNKSGVGSSRHTNDFGTRAFDFQGFRDIDHQIRFLTRMALVAEEMGLEPNVGLGLSEGVQITHFDVNGHEVSGKRQCTKKCTCKKKKKKKCTCSSSCSRKNGSTTWSYGKLSTLQSWFHTEIENGRVSNKFIAQVIGSQPAVEVAAVVGESEELPFITRAVVTFYGPGSSSSIEGPWKTYADNLERVRDSAGDGVPRTLDDVRRGKFSYVSLASAPENLGKFYYMGAITYQSPIDRKVYTGDKRFAEKGSLCEDGTETCRSPVEIVYDVRLSHVVGYTHDTGNAFKADTCARYETCATRLRKFDVAVGDFRGWPGKDTEKFVDEAVLQAYGHSAEHAWQQFVWFAQVASAPSVTSIE